MNYINLVNLLFTRLQTAFKMDTLSMVASLVNDVLVYTMERSRRVINEGAATVEGDRVTLVNVDEVQ